MSMNNNSDKDQLNNLLISGNLRKVVKFITNLKSLPLDIRLQIAGQHNALRQKIIAGVLSSEELLRQENILRSGIILSSSEFLEDLDESSESSISTQLNHIAHNVEELKRGQAILLIQSVDTHKAVFDSLVEQNSFFEKIKPLVTKLIQENSISKEWYNRTPKDKVKIVIPFIVGRLEREYDLNGAKFPTSWSEFKSIIFSN